MPEKCQIYSMGMENPPVKSHDDDPDVEVRCGLGRCRPKVLQSCNNSKVMIVIMSLCVFFQGFIVNGVFNVNVSSLERRFKLRSAQMGMVAATYDISAAVFGLLASYLGSGRYKPRWLAFACLCLATGAIVLVIPHFTTGLYEWGQGVNSYCDFSKNVTTDEGKCESSGLQDYMGVFVLSMVLFGLGGSILYTVGIAYIDDSVKALMSPVYMGIYFASAATGPGVGYLAGGSFLNSYVDIDQVDSSSITMDKDDARWVGAWWIGPSITVVLYIIMSLTLLLFGAELPAAKEVRESRVSQIHNAVTTKQEVTLPSRPELKSMPKVILSLFKNPPFLFTTLAGISEAMYVAGISTFIAKFVQNVFNLSSGAAAVYAGAGLIPGMFGGFMCGGFICRCFRFKVKGMLRLSSVACALSLCCVALVYASCEQVKVAGVHFGYAAGSGNKELHDTCNKPCGCSTSLYEVACDESGAQYFSPCFAGCTASSDDNTVFSNCSCIAGPSAANASSVTSGVCQTKCSKLIVFLILLFLVTFFTLFADVPAEQAVLRSIEENHRTIMLGTTRLFTRLLGMVPGVVIFGAATDAGCLVWQTECGTNTSCWIYDNDIIKRNFFIMGITMKAFSLICFTCAFCFYKPPRDIDTETDISKETNQTSEIVEKEFMNKSFETDITDKVT